MQDIGDIARFLIAADSVNPLRSVLEVDIAGSTRKFAISEDVAHRMCSDLERFLTRVQRTEGKLRRRM
jgi:hypothetical protein